MKLFMLVVHKHVVTRPIMSKLVVLPWQVESLGVLLILEGSSNLSNFLALLSVEALGVEKDEEFDSSGSDDFLE